MSTIICNQCGVEIEVTAALQGQIEQQVLEAARKAHQAELAKVRAEAEATAKHQRQAAEALAEQKLAGEKELLAAQSKAELELARQKLEMEAETARKRQAAQTDMLITSLREDAANDKQAAKEMRGQLDKLMAELRQERTAKENAQLEAQKKLAEEEAKIREEVQKSADERQRLNLAAKEKTITDLQKALDEAQRKAAQGSQQLQGEIMELDLEQALTQHFRDDDIQPVAKGVNGADISQTVKSRGGVGCGVILWEIKRTKNWTDGWIPKLKADLRGAKANIPVIITEAMPKQIDGDLGQLEGVWIARPKLALVLAALLRKGLLDAGRQKAIAAHQEDSAAALYSFVTSHEFIQQIESMVETYGEMTQQIAKERIAYERLWAQREKQAQKLWLSTANIIGSMQGHVGQASMPKIKGLELLEAGEDEDETADAAGNLTLV